MLNRRQFNRNATLATLAAGTGQTMGAEAPQEPVPPDVIALKENGWMPNNGRLPVLHYRAVLPTGGDAASAAEAIFQGNGWPPQWRNGVYTFHHYHSTAHEVLGFTRGEAQLVLGGEGGRRFDIRAGDVLVLPTGTGHCELSCSSGFQVIGAYPPGQTWDICRTAPDHTARARMAGLAFPASDPVHGRAGPLPRLWRV